MKLELKQAEKSQYDLWKMFNYWQEVCSNPKATVKDYTERAKILDKWQTASELVTALNAEIKLQNRNI